MAISVILNGTVTSDSITKDVYAHPEPVRKLAFSEAKIFLNNASQASSDAIGKAERIERIQSLNLLQLINLRRQHGSSTWSQITDYAHRKTLHVASGVRVMVRTWSSAEINVAHYS